MKDETAKGVYLTESLISSPNPFLSNPYSKVTKKKLKTIHINKPIYKKPLITPKPLNQSKKRKYFPKYLSTNSKGTRSLTPLFNNIPSSSLNKELNQLSSCDYIRNNNQRSVELTAKQFKANFLKQELTLLPLKKVVFRFDNPVQKAKINRYLIDFPNITLLTNHNNITSVN